MSKKHRQGTPRIWERQDNNRRSAWNRVGRQFNLDKKVIEIAKKSGLNPHKILRHPESYTADSIRYYIETGGATPVHYDSMADYLIDREIDRLTEIARLEEDGLDMQTIIAQVGEQWW